MKSTGVWLSINDYSNIKDVSISTIRRYIKADRVSWKKEDGRYLIFMGEDKYNELSNKYEGDNLKEKLFIEELKIKMRALQNENNELKMLVDLYEQGHRLETKNQLPPVPLS